MKSSFQRIRDRVQIPQNCKEVQNYIYFTDKVLGNGNYSVVYEAINKNNSKFQSYSGDKIAAKVINLTLYSDPKMV